MSKKVIIVIILIIFILGVFSAGVFWWWQAKKGKAPPAPAALPVSREEAEKARRRLETLTAIKAFDDQIIEGVSVLKETDKKIIKNEDEGYIIEIPLNLIMARSIESSELHFYWPDSQGNLCGDPQCPALISIKTEANPAGSSLEEWSERKEKQVGYPMFQEKEELVISGEKAYRIKEESIRTPPIYYYFLARANKIYRISLGVALEPQYRKYLATFRLQ